MASRKYLIVIILLLSVNLIYAQRPKIGLTLSGGGAKGLAHVGILQAIDSAGLKIDYITGTSMGSIIGAMYASGYSGNQIDSIAKKLDWDELLSGKPKFTDVGMDEKDEFEKYSLEVPLKGLKPRLNTGLIESEEVWLQFSEILFHVYDQKDFTKFNIPFKCIATDLSTGAAVVLDTGEIVKALRSSMAIPGVFSSVDYNNTQLVDGGIIRNFPVSDVIEMGANYVIGVNLFKGLSKADELSSALDVMYQITNYRDAEDLIKQKKKCDILIEPPLDKYSAGSFSSTDEILEIGYDMREKYYPYFKRLADSLNKNAHIDYNPYNRYEAKKTVILDDYYTVGLETIPKEILIHKAGLKLGKAYNAHELNEAFRRLYSTLYFQYIYYELIPTKPGHAKIRVIIKEQLPSQFKVAFSFHTFTTPAVFLNYTMRNLVFDKSRSMIKIALSQDLKGLIEHKQFFGKNLENSVTFSLSHTQQGIPIYQDNEKAYLYKTAFTIGDVNYQYYFGQNRVVGVNLSYRNLNFSPDIAKTFRFDGYNRDIFSKLTYEINTTNRSFLPTEGIEAEFAAGIVFNRKFNSRYQGNDSTNIDTALTIIPKDPLFRFNFHVNIFKELSSKTTILYNFQGGMLFDDENFYLDNFLVGGNNKIYRNQFTFSGYQDGQIAATSFVSGLVGIQYKFMDKLYILGKANIGTYNFVSSYGIIKEIKHRFISGFSGAVAYNLSLLPMEFSINYSPEINTLFSQIRIGFIF